MYNEIRILLIDTKTKRLLKFTDNNNKSYNRSFYIFFFDNVLQGNNHVFGMAYQTVAGTNSGVRKK